MSNLSNKIAFLTYLIAFGLAALAANSIFDFAMAGSKPTKDKTVLSRIESSSPVDAPTSAKLTRIAAVQILNHLICYSRQSIIIGK